MSALETPEVEIGFPAPSFRLKGIDGKFYSPEEAKGPNGLVVMFICNHCPFVRAIADKLTRDFTALGEIGVNGLAVMSNDTDNYPEDSFENMKLFAKEHAFPFPYVIDETQATAKAYGAVCTPDFFGFDKNLKLAYRGRLDESGMNKTSGGSRDLFEAMKQLAETGKISLPQKHSIGCSIKWRD
jgi:peroxiredoxin